MIVSTSLATPSRLGGIQMQALHLSGALAAVIERGARAACPQEYCGALLGCRVGAILTATDVVRLRNSDTRPGRFSIADAEIRHAGLVAREIGCEVLSILHSHGSSPPTPSERDRSAIEYSGYPWVIAGFDRDDRFQLAAFQARSMESLPVCVTASL